MTEATAVYRALMLEIERRRVFLGLTHEQANDLAGLQDGYLAKAMHADTPSGRQAQWATVQTVMDTFWPEGFDLVIRAKEGEPLTRERQLRKMRHTQATGDKRTQRELMRELGRRGAAVTNGTRTERQRKKAAKLASRHAAKARQAAARKRKALRAQGYVLSAHRGASISYTGKPG